MKKNTLINILLATAIVLVYIPTNLISHTLCVDRIIHVALGIVSISEMGAKKLYERNKTDFDRSIELCSIEKQLHIRLIHPGIYCHYMLGDLQIYVDGGEELSDDELKLIEDSNISKLLNLKEDSVKIFTSVMVSDNNVIWNINDFMGRGSITYFHEDKLDFKAKIKQKKEIYKDWYFIEFYDLYF